jgi:hypothetical protein
MRCWCGLSSHVPSNTASRPVLLRLRRWRRFVPLSRDAVAGELCCVRVVRACMCVCICVYVLVIVPHLIGMRAQLDAPSVQQAHLRDTPLLAESSGSGVVLSPTGVVWCVYACTVSHPTRQPTRPVAYRRQARQPRRCCHCRGRRHQRRRDHCRHPRAHRCRHLCTHQPVPSTRVWTWTMTGAVCGCCMTVFVMNVVWCVCSCTTVCDCVGMFTAMLACLYRQLPCDDDD